MMSCRSCVRRSGSPWKCLVAGMLAGAALLAGVLGVPGCAGTDAGARPAARESAPALTAEQRDAYARSFDHVWTTVKEKHWSADMGGVDWDAVKAELRPKVETAATADEARRVLREMLERIGKSHYGIISADSYSDLAAERESGGSGDGDTGISVRVVGERAVVWRIRPGSPAEAAGVGTGWIITKVGDRPVDRAIEAVRKAMPDSTTREFASAMVVQSRLRGAPGDSLGVTFLDGADRERALDLVLDTPPGERTQLGNLPVTRVTFDSRRIDGDIGYFTFSPFLGPAWLMPQIQEFVGSCSGCSGMIVDLRGNAGGMIPMTMGIAGFFVSQPDTKLGRMVTRDTTLNLVVNPRLGGFAGPVAVLVDGSSVSASEILSGGLQDIGRARIFGSTTAGACLPSVVEKLPSGDGFQYAFADYISAGGGTLEGRGVIPDEPVPVTREALLAGRDEALEAAVRWIRSRPQ